MRAHASRLIPGGRALCIILVFLAACSGPPRFTHPLPDADPDATISRILVATSRGPSQDPALAFEGERSDTLSFLEFDISVPHLRKPGSLRFPNSEHPDPKRQFLSRGQDSLASDAAFLTAVNADLHSRPPEARNLLVYAHGYNMNFPESVFRLAQIQHDFDFKGTAVLYSWPSAARIPLYAYDRDSALFARDGLADLLRILARSEARQIIVLGHSMGALLTMETLRTLDLSSDRNVIRRLDAVVLAAPDIDMDVFRGQMRTIDPRDTTIVVMGSRRDHAIRASSIITGGHSRVGEAENIEELRSLGVVVIDLSGLEDAEGLGHTTFATSPTLLKLISGDVLTNAVLNASPGQNILLRGANFATNASIALIYLPTLVVSGQ